VATLSAALATLGVYASVPGPDELERQARLAGGEHVLAAALANALYGAAVSLGMLAEGHMMGAGAGGRELGLVRAQVLKASGAEGPGVMGVMQWQAAQLAGVWRGLSRERDLGPMGRAVADTAWALVVLLEMCTVTDIGDERFPQLHERLAEAVEHLADARGELDGIRDLAAALVEMG
jgi:hypothetical protein